MAFQGGGSDKTRVCCEAESNRLRTYGFLRFNPGQQLSARQPLTHSPCSGRRDRIGRLKVKKPVGQDKNS